MMDLGAAFVLFIFMLVFLCFLCCSVNKDLYLPQNAEWSNKCNDVEVTTDNLQNESSQRHDGHGKVKTTHNSSHH